MLAIIIVYVSRRIRPQTVLTLTLEGWVEEQASHNRVVELLAGPPLTVTDIVEGLDRARTDSRIAGLELRVGETTMQMANLQEIRQKIADFNRAGKFSVAYLEFAANRTYFLASAPAQVGSKDLHMQPGGATAAPTSNNAASATR